jgi:predicted O-methyltransferase YrrM
VRLARPGSVIVVDNVIRDGEILEPEADDPRVRATRQTLQLMGEHPALDTAVIQTVGAKHWDGFALSLVR